MGMSGGESYVLMKDAGEYVNKAVKVNLCGAVVEFGFPRKSKGSDYFCTVKIVDASSQEHGLSVNIFTEDMAMLPRVRSSGDIITLHNVLMKDHKGDVQALFSKKCSSFALFEGKSCTGFNPYQIYSNFHITDQDEVAITQMRTWLAHHKFDVGMNEYSLQLRDIKAGQYFDLVCKILHISVVVDDVLILYVWDGTDAPPTEIEMNLDDEARNPLPLQLERSSLSRDVLCTFPCVGTVLRFTVGKFFEDLGLQLQGRGQWVKFRNITCRLQSGLWKGVLLPSSKIRLLSDEDSAVKHCERCYKERVSTGVDHLPRQSNITAMGYGHVRSSSLMEVLTCTKVTQKFKCVVRFVAIYPWRPEDFRSPETGLYRIRFTLEDPTARIRAYLYGEDGEEFFGGYPPTDVLTNKMKILLGIPETVEVAGDNACRNPPWVQLCIKSYYLDEKDPWTTRRYRIFGARLVC